MNTTARISVFLLAIVGISCTSCSDRTQTGKAKQHSEGTIQFSHPGHWSVIDTDPDDLEIEVSSNTTDTEILIRIVNVDEPSAVETSIQELMQNRGFRADPEYNDIGSVELGRLDGYGYEYNLSLQNKPYRMIHHVNRIGASHILLIRYLTPEKTWNSDRPGLLTIANSIVVQSFSDQTPDTDQPTLFSNDWCSFSVPSNWDKQATAHEQYENVWFTSDLGSSFTTVLYDRPVPFERELEVYLENALDQRSITLIDTNPTELMGMKGAGAIVTLNAPPHGYEILSVLFVPLEDGRVFGIRTRIPQNAAEPDSQGFDLIESTLKLKHTPKPTTEP